MSIGPALLWSLLFLGVYALLTILTWVGVGVPIDGVAVPFQLSAGVAGLAYATLGAYLSYRVCRVLFRPAPALWGTLVAWLATSAVYYSAVSPAYSHSASLFAVALFTLVWLRTREDERLGRYALMGALAGLATLVRWQDSIILLLPVLDLIRRRERPLAAALRLGALGAALATVLIPQLLAWHRIYGQFFLMPQGSSFMRWTDPQLLAVLFSPNHGLLLWTPAVIPAVIGLSLLVRRDRWLGWASLAVLLLSIYVNAAVSDWWAGEAFGARRFVGNTVFFALGLTTLFSVVPWIERPSRLRWTAIALIVYNLLFVLQYQLFMRGFRELSPYPATTKQILVDRLIVPLRLVRYWLNSGDAIPPPLDPP